MILIRAAARIGWIPAFAGMTEKNQDIGPAGGGGSPGSGMNSS
jgi:hypothetical protein